MRTKKTLCLVITAILLLCIGATALTGCNTPLTAREAYDELMAALDLSVSGDMYGPAYDPETSATNGYIFYYKESVRTDSMIVNTNVNVHCDQDAAYNLHVDEDLMVDLYQETWSISSVTGGTGTKIGDFGFIVGPYPDADSAEERLFYTERPSDGVSATAPEYTDVTLYDDMTAEDFIASDFFRGYSLSSRLEELRNMPFEALGRCSRAAPMWRSNSPSAESATSMCTEPKISAAASSTCRRRCTAFISPTSGPTSPSPMRADIPPILRFWTGPISPFRERRSDRQQIS